MNYTCAECDCVLMPEEPGPVCWFCLTKPIDRPPVADYLPPQEPPALPGQPVEDSDV